MDHPHVSSELRPYLVALGELTCEHKTHKRQAVGYDEVLGKWRSADAAAYPAAMNALLVQAIVAAMRAAGGEAGACPVQPAMSDGP